MLTIKPEPRLAVLYYAKLSLLASLIGILVCSITIAMDHYLTTAAIIAIVVTVSAAVFILAIPLFLLFYRRETGKTWIVSEDGVEIRRADNETKPIPWARVREIFIKRHSISIFLQPDGEEESIYFMDGFEQEEFSRFWHTFRTDHPDRRQTAPEDNKL